MSKRAVFILTFMLAAPGAMADDDTNNVLVDMFAWWNDAIKNEDGFTREAFGRYFTEDARIIVNDVMLVQGLEPMAEHFRGIQQRTESVEIVLPFEEGFREGDRIFTYHLIRARENGVDRLSHVMGYAIVEDGKLALINFLSHSDPAEP
ncbi:MAG: hypothetical protein ACREQ1_14730 [Woeseiaceae bacterium]